MLIDRSTPPFKFLIELVLKEGIFKLVLHPSPANSIGEYLIPKRIASIKIFFVLILKYQS